MAEDPTFSGMSSGDAAEAFAKVTAQIKSDMASIEASAKNIERSLGKASKHSLGGGSSFGAKSSGGGTGFGNDTGMTLGAITSGLGGARGIGTVAGFGLGAMGGGIAGGVAVAGLSDLIIRPERALGMENARFGMAQATGQFSSFQNMMDTARNRFNVQNEQAFLNTMVYGTQRMGMVGMMGGGTVGERRAAEQIGGYNTLAGMAGIDQSMVPGAMASMNGAGAYYAGMASGIQTRNPVTGELLGVEQQVNQMWAQTGITSNMSEEERLKQIDIQYGVGSMGERQLLDMYGGDVAAVELAKEGLRLRAKTGKPLEVNQVQNQAKEAGVLGTEMTQGNEGVRALEGEKMAMGAEYLNDATAGIEEATKHITNAVTLLKDLEGPLRDIVAGYTTLANQMDVFKTELPNATQGITDFFTGLPGLLASYLMGKFGIPGAGSLLSKAGPALKAVGRVAGPVGLAVGGATSLYETYKGGEEDNKGKAAVGLGGAILTGVGVGGLATSWSGPGMVIGGIVGGLAAGGAYMFGRSKTNDAGGRSKGDWFVEADQTDRIHYGEMVLPSRIATAVREELAVGKTSPSESAKSKDGTTVNIYLTVQRATDQEAISFANRVKRIIDMDEELLAIGSGRLGAYA